MIGGNPVEAVLFDKDGTLFDFHKSWAGWARLLLADLSDGGDHAARLAVAMGFVPETGRFRPDSPVIAATSAEITALLIPLVPGLESAALAQRLGRAGGAVRMVPVVPLRPVLMALRRRGLALGLATNDTEAAARAHLQSHGVAPLFDFIAGYDSGLGAKPDPGMCLAFARAMQVVPARVVMVGDSRHDLRAGRAAGMTTVAVLTGVARAEDLADLADAVLSDIGGLAGWLDRRAVGDG